MPTSDRAIQMRNFAEGEGLMTNARCLTEGVDLPAIDCVVFTDPKRSKVDIVQAAGRALRLSKGKKFGYILIPIFIPDGADFNEAAEEQGFNDIAVTVRALATTDTRITEYLRVISEGKKPRGGSPVDGITSVNSLYKVEAEEFDKAIKLKVWESVAPANYLSYEEAKNIVSLMGFKSNKDFINWKRKSKSNLDMPFKPDKIYKNSGWISWPSFLGKKREIFNVNWLKIDLAKKFIQKFNIKSLSAYQRFVLENKNKFPNNIPLAPVNAYKGKGWKSWPDYLGNTNVASGSIDYKNFYEAKKYLKDLRINSRREYTKLHKEGKIQNMPQDITQYYGKNQNWKGAADFFSRADLYNKNKTYYPYKKASKFVQDNQISSFEELKEFAIANNLNHFPYTDGHARRIYGKKKYKGQKLFFGKERFPKRKRFISFVNAKKILTKYNIKSVPNYFPIQRELAKNSVLMPAKPNEVYKDEWKGWPDFLGKKTKS
jgi:hypothetical protein